MPLRSVRASKLPAEAKVRGVAAMTAYLTTFLALFDGRAKRFWTSHSRKLPPIKSIEHHPCSYRSAISRVDPHCAFATDSARWICADGSCEHVIGCTVRCQLWILGLYRDETGWRAAPHRNASDVPASIHKRQERVVCHPGAEPNGRWHVEVMPASTVTARSQGPSAASAAAPVTPSH